MIKHPVEVCGVSFVCAGLLAMSVKCWRDRDYGFMFYFVGLAATALVLILCIESL